MIFVGAFFFISCEKSAEPTGEFISTNPDGWNYDETLIFNEECDTLVDTDFYSQNLAEAPSLKNALLSVTHTYDYPYANLWLEIAYLSADSVMTDTFNITLSDKYGKWLGSGSGPVVTRADTIRFRHNPNINSQFRLRHIMRLDALADIEKVGLTFLTQ